jgi:hypothetical protein
MLTDQELDDVYTRACYAMTELGEARQPLFLARLALLPDSVNVFIARSTGAPRDIRVMKSARC